MLDFVIFAITFAAFLVLLVFYLYPGSRKQTTIPGLDPSDSKDGNISDIIQAGSFPEFLINLHKEHGEIASFWMGTQIVVSIASPELFEQQIYAFDKPAELYALYRPLVGENSILYLNGSDWRKKRQIWDMFFSPNQSDTLAPHLEELVSELVDKWSSLPADQHIPLYQYMAAFCMKVCTQLAFGDFIQDKSILDFNKNFEICWTELEAQVTGQIPEPNSPRDQRFKEGVTTLQNFVRNAIKFSKSNNSKCTTFLEAMINTGLTENELVDEALTFVVKFYSLASTLTWAIYFVSSHEDVQSRLFKELSIHKTTPIKIENLQKISYLQQVIKESLRVASVEPWTARYQDVDVEIGKHVVPKKTPVIQALQVVLQSDQFWSLPKNFDPDRYSKEDDTSNLSTFHPYGFAGKRQCPANSFSNFYTSIILKEICTKFELNFVTGQVVIPKYRMCTRLEDEIWLTLKKR